MLLTFATNAAASDKLPKGDKPPREKVVCRSHDVISSHIPQTECHTAKEWQQISQANKNNADDFSAARRSNNVQPSTGLGAGS
jgi:type II secretory pathway component PulJ